MAAISIQQLHCEDPKPSSNRILKRMIEAYITARFHRAFFGVVSAPQPPESVHRGSSAVASYQKDATSWFARTAAPNLGPREWIDELDTTGAERLPSNTQ
ncbi:hypothetical protein VTI28DRAFT_6896 [Corynascus sepedonium]